MDSTLTEIQLFDDESDETEMPTTDVLSSPGYMAGAPKGIVIDNELHIIGDHEHLKYDAEYDSFQLLHEIPKFFVGQGMARIGTKLFTFGGLCLNEFPLEYSNEDKWTNTCDEEWAVCL